MKCHIIGNRCQPVIAVPLEQTEKLIAYRDGLIEREKEAQQEVDALRAQITRMRLASIHFDQDTENWTAEIEMGKELVELNAEGPSQE